MPGGETVAGPEKLEREMAALEERMNFLRNESRLFGRLGFSAEQARFELRQLEKRHARCEAALKELRSGSQKVMALDFGKAES